MQSAAMNQFKVATDALIGLFPALRAQRAVETRIRVDRNPKE